MKKKSFALKHLNTGAGYKLKRRFEGGKPKKVRQQIVTRKETHGSDILSDSEDSYMRQMS